MNEMKARGVPRPVVAVVTGATGAVGAAAVRELTRGLEPGDTLVLVGRSGDRLKALQGEANAENPTLAVWLEELSLPVGGGPGEISEAVSVVLNRIAKHPAASGAVAGGSAVLLNAIGPSASMSIPLAAAALCAGFHVVDPGGSDRVIGGVDGSARAGARAALFGAGVQPGLTGMMMGRAVLLAGNPAESRVTILVGGRQRLTRSTLDEYLSSLSADGGWPGAIWRGGRVLCGHGSSEVAIPGYVPPKGATVSVHLDEEYAHRAGALGVGELRAANLMDAPQTVSAMRRWVAGEMTADVVAEVSAQEVAQTASDAAGKTPWFGIDVHVIGATGLEVCARFRCEDSYAASGMAAAQAARAVVGRGTIGAIAPGAHWASATAAADSWAAWPEVTISCERREQQPGGIAVIGAGFGAHYARALVGAPRARLSCIGGRGGPCGRALAEELGVTYVSLEDASIPSRERLPGALVGAVVAVRSEIVGGEGDRIAEGFLRAGIPVLQELPLAPDTVSRQLTLARQHRTRFLACGLYEYTAPVRWFIRAVEHLRRRTRVTHVLLRTSHQIMDRAGCILAEALGAVPVGSHSSAGTAAPEWAFVSGRWGRIPVDVMVARRLDPRDPDNHSQPFMSAVVETADGELTWEGPAAAPRWHPRPHSRGGRIADPEGATAVTWGPPGGDANASTWGDVVGRVWPEAIRAAVADLVEGGASPEEVRRRDRRTLLVLRWWYDVSARLPAPERITSREPVRIEPPEVEP